MNSLSSCTFGLRPAEQGRLLSFATTMCSPSTTSTFSMVTNGNLNTPSFVPPLGRAVGVLDIQQVDISDLLHEPVGVGVLQADFVDTLELSRSGVAIGPQRSAAN